MAVNNEVYNIEVFEIIHYSYEAPQPEEVEEPHPEEVEEESIPDLIEEEEICVLCGTPHSTRNCNNNFIMEFEILCVNTFHHSSSTDDFQSRVYELIMQPNYIRAFMAFAIRDCGCTRLSSIAECMVAVTLYLDANYTLGHGMRIEQERTLQEPPRPHQTVSVSRFLSNVTGLPDESVLQQFANITLRPHQVRTGLRAEIEIIASLEEGDHECCVCWETNKISQFVGYRCGHEFCKDCVINTIQKRRPGRGITCALCRSSVDKIICRSQEISAEFEEYLHK